MAKTFKGMLAEEQVRRSENACRESVMKKAQDIPDAVEEEEKISDQGVYLSNMSKSFPDKAWFLKYVPDDISSIVDFGSGSGEFCEYIKAMLEKKGLSPEFTVIDNNPAFLSQAASRGFNVFSSLEDYMTVLHEGRTLLIMSSVIHEIYSYADEFYDDVGTFWTTIGKCGFDVIAIRDMSISDSDYRNVPKDAVLWVYENVFRNGGLAIKGKPLAELLSEFEEVWGPVANVRTGRVDVKNLIHFLIKYRYVENWRREVLENYLPVTQDKLQKILKGMGYSLVHKESSRLPFYATTWTKDFKLGIPDDGDYRRTFAKWLYSLNTHIKWLAAK